VIALTGCLASRFCQRLLDDREQEARARAGQFAGNSQTGEAGPAHEHVAVTSLEASALHSPLRRSDRHPAPMIRLR